MLKVASNQRSLMHDDGRPFFYLADTAWSLLQRLDREETLRYLQDRASKGFTAIQMVALSEFDGLRDPNRYGDLPLHDEDPTTPNEAYFAHVDWVIEQANSLGMYVALLPTWGDKVGPLQWGVGPVVFTPGNAQVYGEFLGRRYRDRDIIWVIGGDRNPSLPEQQQVWSAMAHGIARGDEGRGLMTFHPQGQSTSADYFHNAAWLDFNMLQSGHGQWDSPNHQMIEADYARTPAKPCLDGEPCYEDHPVNWKPELGYFGAYDARKAAYRAVFSGAMGHTYGANGIFQFWKGGQPDHFSARTPWEDALALPGAAQMQHVRALMESRPYFVRVPDQSLLLDASSANLRATRAQDGSYAMIYSALGEPFALDLRRLGAAGFDANWYDPRLGTWQTLGRIESGDAQMFTPPSQGADHDWVLVLDAIKQPS